MPSCHIIGYNNLIWMLKHENQQGSLFQLQQHLPRRCRRAAFRVSTFSFLVNISAKLLLVPHLCPVDLADILGTPAGRSSRTFPSRTPGEVLSLTSNISFVSTSRPCKIFVWDTVVRKFLSQVSIFAVTIDRLQHCSFVAVLKLTL